MVERDGTLIGFAKVTRDLTQRRALEEERIRRATLERALAEQKRTDELRELLVGVVGHDLRSPLASITMGAATMLKKGRLEDADVKATARIARSADRMAKIRHGKPDGPIDVRLRAQGDAVCLQIHNDGSPIPADLLPSIFDPFRRHGISATRNSDGLGLGLFIVREMVRAHSGEIGVQSTEAEGTTFSVTLPRR
jgi:signal transduction histidine kinase